MFVIDRYISMVNKPYTGYIRTPLVELELMAKLHGNCQPQMVSIRVVSYLLFYLISSQMFSSNSHFLHLTSEYDLFRGSPLVYLEYADDMTLLGDDVDNIHSLLNTLSNNAHIFEMCFFRQYIRNVI